MDLFTTTLKSGVPIVNSTNIKSFVNKEVMIYGKKDSYSQRTLFLSTTEEKKDDTVVMIRNIKEEDINSSNSDYFCIIGMVDSDGSVNYIDQFTEGMENFEFLENVNKLINLYKVKKDIRQFVFPESQVSIY